MYSDVIVTWRHSDFSFFLRMLFFSIEIIAQESEFKPDFHKFGKTRGKRVIENISFAIICNLAKFDDISII